MNEKKRVTYLDMAKGIGIILMVVGHLIGSVQTIDYKEYLVPVYHWLTSFHMPLFFIISGILLRITKEEERPMRQIIVRKMKTLLLPYVTFSIIYLVLNVWNCIFHPELLSFSDLGKFVVYSVTFRGVSVLWFLPALFIGELLFLWCRQGMDDKHLIYFFSLTGCAVLATSPAFRLEEWERSYAAMAAGALLQTACRGVLAGTFLMIGYYFTGILQKNEKRSIGGFFWGAVLLLTGSVLCFWNGTVDLNYMVFENIMLYMFCACASSFGILLLCKNSCHLRILQILGENSLVIMATHMEFGVMLNAIQISYWLNQYVTRAKEYVLFITMAACIALMETVIVYIYNHYLYFLIGKRSMKKTK